MRGKCFSERHTSSCALNNNGQTKRSAAHKMRILKINSERQKKMKLPNFRVVLFIYSIIISGITIFIFLQRLSLKIMIMNLPSLAAAGLGFLLALFLIIKLQLNYKFSNGFGILNINWEKWEKRGKRKFVLFYSTFFVSGIVGCGSTIGFILIKLSLFTYSFDKLNLMYMLLITAGIMYGLAISIDIWNIHAKYKKSKIKQNKTFTHN